MISGYDIEGLTNGLGLQFFIGNMGIFEINPCTLYVKEINKNSISLLLFSVLF